MYNIKGVSKVLSAQLTLEQIKIYNWDTENVYITKRGNLCASQH